MSTFYSSTSLWPICKTSWNICKSDFHCQAGPWRAKWAARRLILSPGWKKHPKIFSKKIISFLLVSASKIKFSNPSNNCQSNKCMYWQLFDVYNCHSTNWGVIHGFMEKLILFVTLLYTYIVPQSFKIGLIVILHPMTPTSPCQLMSYFQLPPPPSPKWMTQFMNSPLYHV